MIAINDRFFSGNDETMKQICYHHCFHGIDLQSKVFRAHVIYL
jgi:hypothetical protein